MTPPGWSPLLFAINEKERREGGKDAERWRVREILEESEWEKAAIRSRFVDTWAREFPVAGWVMLAIRTDWWVRPKNWKHQIEYRKGPANFMADRWTDRPVLASPIRHSGNWQHIQRSFPTSSFVAPGIATDREVGRAGIAL